jgi:hypothetical protein
MELLLLAAAIYLGRRAFKNWKAKRDEEAWVRQVLAPGAGLTHGVGGNRLRPAPGANTR